MYRSVNGWNSNKFSWNKNKTKPKKTLKSITISTPNNYNNKRWRRRWQKLSARHSRTNEKSSVMWLNTIVGRAGGGAASKALSTVRYSTIGLHERSASGQIILPLDVEETVTCFCRFDLCIFSCSFVSFFSSIFYHHHFPFFLSFFQGFCFKFILHHHSFNLVGFFTLWFGFCEFFFKLLKTRGA